MMFPGGKNFVILASPLDKNCRAILLPGFCTHEASSESDTSDSSSYSSLQGVAARPRRTNLKGWMHVYVINVWCQCMYGVHVTVCNHVSIEWLEGTHKVPILLGLYWPLESRNFLLLQRDWIVTWPHLSGRVSATVSYILERNESTL